MAGPTGVATAPDRRTRHRVRRSALTLGLLAGLALAPTVGTAVREGSFDTRDNAVATATTVTPHGTPAAGAGGTRGHTAPAGPTDDDAPVFTHRSARLEDVAKAPAALRIPALGIDAPIVARGRDGSGQLDVPPDASTVVWYRAGSVPGGAGSAVLAAHVDYDGQRGVFYDLDRVQAGDTVRVTFDDGSSKAFEVVSRQRYTKRRLPVRRLFTRDGDAVLTLITCGGQFNATTRHYASNTVVQATLR